MKYGVIPTNLAECFALWSGKVPVPALDVIFTLMKARSVMAGVSLGLFESLKDGPLTPAEVARRCRLNAECTELLLRALAGVGYVEQLDDCYALTELSRHTLISGAKHHLSGYVQWNYTQWEMVEQLEELIRTGQGMDFHQKMDDSERWADYQRAMLDVARFQTPIVASKVPVKPGARRLLDLAGSHGLIGAAICRLHPLMTSEVMDLPEAIEQARALAREEQIDDIVTHRSGDLLRDDYGRDYDVVVAANILHHFQEAENLKILRRVYDSLSEAGTVAIWEIEAPDKMATASEADSATLFFRLTSNARCYSGGDYAGWLQKVGFEQVQVVRPMFSSGYVLITGRKAEGAGQITVPAEVPQDG
jgi:2-polyprenyl-3-methyl-5-hydroxy-6-metoxy-1,4-benzoquinol methylase